MYCNFFISMFFQVKWLLKGMFSFALVLSFKVKNQKDFWLFALFTATID